MNQSTDRQWWTFDPEFYDIDPMSYRPLNEDHDYDKYVQNNLDNE